MRKGTCWKILFPALLCLLLAVPAASFADGISLRVTPYSVSKPGTLAEVGVWTDETGDGWLFLPAGWDTAALRVWFTDTDTMMMDGSEVCSGDVVACLQNGAAVSVQQGQMTARITVMQSASIPAVFLRTESGSLQTIHETKGKAESGGILITDCDGSVVCEQALTSLRCRGNSSFTLTDKKCYQFKLTRSTRLFGMSKGKTWILTAGFRDRSLIRNKLVYDMARYVGLPNAISACLTDVYVNGEYRGTYTLSEKIEISGSRLNINDLEKQTQKVNDQPTGSYPKAGPSKATPENGIYYKIPKDPEDITGGYIIRNEAVTHYWEAGSCYVTRQENLIEITEPDCISKAQFSYISSLIQSFEDAIFAKNGRDPKTGRYYTEIGDLNSFVLKYMLEEIAKSYDANHNSQYMYKPADSISTLLYAGPAWDYDTCLGSYAANGKQEALLTSGYWVNRAVEGSWYNKLCEKADFMEAVYEAWRTKYRPATEILRGIRTDENGVLQSVEAYAALVERSAAMDYIRWPKLVRLTDAACGSNEFRENIAQLSSFVTRRTAWLDSCWSR